MNSLTLRLEDAGQLRKSEYHIYYLELQVAFWGLKAICSNEVCIRLELFINSRSFSDSRTTLQSRKIQGDSVSLIIQSWRQPTTNKYECYLTKWFMFSDSRQSDPIKYVLQPAINVIN